MNSVFLIRYKTELNVETIAADYEYKAIEEITRIMIDNKLVLLEVLKLNMINHTLEEVKLSIDYGRFILS